MRIAMKTKPIFALALLIAFPCAAQDMSTVCSPMTKGAVVYNPSDGQHFVCDGVQWSVAEIAPAPPAGLGVVQPPKGGDTRFDAQSGFFEYFDGNAGAWVAVAPR
jgi:hypothetical protein